MKEFGAFTWGMFPIGDANTCGTCSEGYTCESNIVRSRCVSSSNRGSDGTGRQRGIGDRLIGGKDDPEFTGEDVVE